MTTAPRRRGDARNGADVKKPDRTGTSDILREQIYRRLCEELRSGRFVPGEKITIRNLAAIEGVSPTPAREALHRLVADGVLAAEANRSARVPVLSIDQIRELRDIRLAVEPLAAMRAAEHSSPELIRRLRKIAAELSDARNRGDIPTDLAKIYEFQFGLYRACGMPALIKIIEGLWLRTGPYMSLLFPDYIAKLKQRRGDWRERICVALERADARALRAEIEYDLTDALDYVAEVVAAANRLQPARKPQRSTALAVPTKIPESRLRARSRR